MPSIVFPTSSAPGARMQEGAGRLVNGYAVKTEQGAPSPFKWQRSAGLRQVNGDITHVHCRGLIEVGSTVLVVLNERVWSLTESGGVFTATNLGALAGDDPVTLSRDNAGTPNILANCDAGLFNLFINSAPTSFADGDMPSLTSIGPANGYHVGTTGGGALWATGLNAVTVDSGANTNAQSNPDGLLRAVWMDGELIAFGGKTIETFEETGDSPFPFRNKKTPINGGGLIGTHAVAGWQEGWVGKLIWAAEDGTVRLRQGYVGTVISNEDVSRAIRESADRSALQACVYMEGDNAIWELTSPGEWTWCFNVTTGRWHEKVSQGRSDSRLRCTVRAFDRWIGGDDETGKLASVDPSYKFEYGDPLVWDIISGANLNFPYSLEVGSVFLNFTAAQGNAAGSDPIETTPKVSVRFSLNGGQSWGNWIERELGRQGEGDKQVCFNGVGTTRGGKGLRVHARISDPVSPAFMGGEMPDVKARAA